MRHLAAALLAATALLPALPAAAQDGASPATVAAIATDITAAPAAGYVIQGGFALDGTQGYWLTLAPGQGVEVTAQPIGDTDPVLTVFDEAGQVIASNDDYGDGLAARVPLHSAAGQRVRVVVSQLGAATGAPNEAGTAAEGDAGAADDLGDPPHFTLIVAPGSWTATEALVAGELPFSHGGTLPGSSRQAFLFEAAAGQSFEATLRATGEDGYDPYLTIVAVEPGQSAELLSAVAGDLPALAEDDDSGGNLDSQLVFTAPAAGRYAAIASGLGEAGGAYSFDLAAFIRPDPVVIGLDQKVAGVLASRAAPPVYRLSPAAVSTLARRPGPLAITMNKVGEGDDALDPMLEVGFDTPFGPTVIASDDDGGGDLNARVELPLAAGEDLARWLRALRITATAAGSLDSPGAFELTVTQGN